MVTAGVENKYEVNAAIVFGFNRPMTDLMTSLSPPVALLCALIFAKNERQRGGGERRGGV